MKLSFTDTRIPGTLKKMEGLTGIDFLKNVFFANEDGVMMTQIRNISGIESSTLQNWTKRGWVATSKLKKYDMDQVAHILIINMLRSCMQLDHIDFLIHYINGDVEDTSDDIISDSGLYDYICRIVRAMEESGECALDQVGEIVKRVTRDYAEPVPGAKVRLNRALEVICVSYCASVIRYRAEKLLEELR